MTNRLGFLKSNVRYCPDPRSYSVQQRDFFRCGLMPERGKDNHRNVFRVKYFKNSSYTTNLETISLLCELTQCNLDTRPEHVEYCSRCQIFVLNVRKCSRIVVIYLESDRSKTKDYLSYQYVLRR